MTGTTFTDRLGRLKWAIIGAACLVTIEAAGLGLTQNALLANLFIAFAFLMLGPLLVVICVSLRAREAVVLKRQWILLGSASLIELIAIALRAWNVISDVGGYQTRVHIDFTDLIDVFTYIPIFIMLSLPTGSVYPRIFFWVDAAQIAVIGYLVYVRIYALVPFTYANVHPISNRHMFYVYSAGGLCVACLALMRFWIASTTDEKRFYRVYATFAWLGVILAMIRNYYAIKHVNAGFEEILLMVSSAVYCLGVLAFPPEEAAITSKRSPRPLAAFLNTASPAFLTAILMALAIDAARSFPSFGFAAIAAAFILYAVRSTALQRRYEESQSFLQEARDELEVLSLTDGLTGIPNRRHFDRTLEDEWRLSGRSKASLSLLLIDIDYFKRLNDTFGHQHGDDCLVRVASALRSSLPREGDLVARYGGEEFAAILPGTDREGALMVAQRFQQAASELKITNHTEIGDYVSLSIGVATQQFATGNSAAHLIAAADRALYAAKQSGRNRAEVAETFSRDT